MDQAALDRGFGPALRQGSGDPGPAVGDHHPWCREPLQQRRPRGLLLGVTPLPAQHMFPGNSDQTAPRADVDPIDLDLVMDLTGGRDPRDDVPAPGSAPTEGPGRAKRGSSGLAGGAHQPAKERFQLGPATDIRAFTRAARPAVQAPVALFAR